jgi:hypothetical protein
MNTSDPANVSFYLFYDIITDQLCGLVAKVPDDRSIGPRSILGATRFSEK